jgi:hypothetical protein
LKSIKDIVSTLTPEELELHKELIEECTERESSVAEIGENLSGQLEKLTQISLKILLDIDRFNQAAHDLKETCENARDNIVKDSLALIPEDKFYYA